MSRRAPLVVFRLSPLRAAPSVEGVPGRWRRIRRRGTILLLVIGAVAGAVIMLNANILPLELTDALYELHDRFYLPLKGNLWTKILPEGFWIWFAVAVIALLVVASWVSDRSFVMRWHRWALTVFLRLLWLKHALIQSARFLPNGIFPYRLVSAMVLNLWFDALVEFGQAAERGEIKFKHVMPILARWKSLVELNTYRPYISDEQMAEWAAHQLIMLSAACTPAMFGRLFEQPTIRGLTAHVQSFVAATGLQGRPVPDTILPVSQRSQFDVWPELAMLMGLLDAAHGDLNHEDVQAAAAEVIRRFEKRLHIIDHLSHLLYRATSESTPETARQLESFNDRVATFETLRRVDYRLGLDVALWASATAGRPTLALDALEAWQSVSVWVLTTPAHIRTLPGLVNWVSEHQIPDHFDPERLPTDTINALRFYPMLHNSQVRRLARALARHEQERLRDAWKGETSLSDTSAAWITAQHFEFDALSIDANLDFSE